MSELEEEARRLWEERERLLQMLHRARTKSERASILGKLSAVRRRQYDVIHMMMWHFPKIEYATRRRLRRGKRIKGRRSKPKSK